MYDVDRDRRGVTKCMFAPHNPSFRGAPISVSKTRHPPVIPGRADRRVEDRHPPVIPGRADSANPESRTKLRACIWIPGPSGFAGRPGMTGEAASLASRNDDGEVCRPPGNDEGEAQPQGRLARLAVSKTRHPPVIPGRAESANPESRTKLRACIWIPGPSGFAGRPGMTGEAASLASRNDDGEVCRPPGNDDSRSARRNDGSEA
jgi:hypothetical protein